jgi:hypothetical protein
MQYREAFLLLSGQLRQLSRCFICQGNLSLDLRASRDRFASSVVRRRRRRRRRKNILSIDSFSDNGLERTIFAAWILRIHPLREDVEDADLFGGYDLSLSNLPIVAISRR